MLGVKTNRAYKKGRFPLGEFILLTLCLNVTFWCKCSYQVLGNEDACALKCKFISVLRNHNAKTWAVKYLTILHNDEVTLVYL